MSDQFQKLESSFSDSLASERLSDSVAVVADIGLDAVIKSGGFDGVPVFGALLGVAKAGYALREHYFTKKIAKFLIGFNEATESDRKKFVSELRTSGKMHELGTTILLLVEKMEDIEKPKIAGKLLAAAASGKIPLQRAIRLCKMLDHIITDDLEVLKTVQDWEPSTNPIFEILASNGVLSTQGFDPGNMGIPDSGGMVYVLNEYGRNLIEFGLKDA